MDFSPEIVNGIFAVGGAILGAVIAGVFAIFIARSSKDKKEIVVSTSHPSRLLVVHDQIASDVEILVSGNKVDNVILSEIFLSNTGNKAVENLSFPVSCQDSVQLISVDALDQASDAPRAGSVVTKKSGQEIDVTIDYINPGEEISLRCMVSGDEPEWIVALRQPELNVVRREQPVASYSDVVAEIVFEGFANVPILSTYLRVTSPVFKKFLKNRKTG
ncbi:hypothetical protein [Rhodovulum sulfidophilum]|uniref:hypothetical protein n=1 Tax=Rhodovulum sulfidophilum TaxID=35806 RepID=UPI00117BCB77|nr:hypothetical protein [Rhodovulum sulfidophilum]